MISLAQIRACAAASKTAYTRATLTDADSGEQVFIDAATAAATIAFPGTHDLRDIFRDLDCLRLHAMILGRPCSVHAGFDRAHHALIQQIISAVSATAINKPLFITGHSKGAAVAKRCALALLEQNIPVTAVITFGEPRGGDSRYALLYHDALGDRTLRVTNAADPVPWLPAWIAGNRHGGPEAFMPARKNILLTGPALLTKLWSDGREIYRAWQLKDLAPLADHHIDTYLLRLATLES